MRRVWVGYCARHVTVHIMYSYAATDIFVTLFWKLPLHLEVVLAVAMRRFRLWQLPDDDLYKTRFMWSHRLKQSWAYQSLSLIHFWGLVDWVEWKADTFGYKKYARSRLEEICFSRLAANCTGVHATTCIY